MKQETLEEAAENYANKKGHIPTTELEDAIFKQGFLDGAKWQAENMPIHIIDVENIYVHIEDGVIIIEKNKII